VNRLAVLQTMSEGVKTIGLNEDISGETSRPERE